MKPITKMRTYKEYLKVNKRLLMKRKKTIKDTFFKAKK